MFLIGDLGGKILETELPLESLETVIGDGVADARNSGEQSRNGSFLISDPLEFEDSLELDKSIELDDWLDSLDSLNKE